MVWVSWKMNQQLANTARLNLNWSKIRGLQFKIDKYDRYWPNPAAVVPSSLRSESLNCHSSCYAVRPKARRAELTQHLWCCQTEGQKGWTDPASVMLSDRRPEGLNWSSICDAVIQRARRPELTQQLWCWQTEGQKGWTDPASVMLSYRGPEGLNWHSSCDAVRPKAKRPKLAQQLWCCQAEGQKAWTDTAAVIMSDRRPEGLNWHSSCDAVRQKARRVNWPSICDAVRQKARRPELTQQLWCCQSSGQKAWTETEQAWNDPAAVFLSRLRADGVKWSSSCDNIKSKVRRPEIILQLRCYQV